MRILIVEDSEHLAQLVAEGLRDQGMAVDLALDGRDGALKLDVNTYNVVLLDRDLPGVHGDELCRRIVESENRAMILMLTAAGAPRDRVSGLGLGADDYLAKPFHFPELVLRIHALVRRQPEARALVFRSAGVELYPARRTAIRDGRVLQLSPKEFGVLETLMRNEGIVVSTEALLEEVWDEHADPFTNTVLVTISRLRRKLGLPSIIETATGGGYRINH